MRGSLLELRTALITVVVAISTAKASEDATHEGAEVHEVREGGMAILPCLSHDSSHSFVFWQIDPNTIIGPGNPLNRSKYKYEVLSGTLKIRDVRHEEAGLYKCVSRDMDNEGFSIRPVQLVVNKDWEEVWETDHETNLLRAWIAFIVIGILLAGAYFVYRYRRRTSSRFREIPDEEGQEDSMAGVELTAPSTSFIGEGDSTSIVDTDFPKAFNAMYKPMGGVEARL